MPDRRTATSLTAIGLALVAVCILAGCGSTTPTGAGAGGMSGPPDAVPRAEPKSRYGNMESYVVFGKRYYTKPTSRNYRERGVASWYGEPFHGRKTSSGEVYDMHQMTAAHKSLPLPTYARVTNLENGHSAVVKINDRGPFVGDRVIDLSYAAARRLDLVGKGTGPVEVVSIDPRDHGGKTPRVRVAAAAPTPSRAPTPAQAPAPAPAPISDGLTDTARVQPAVYLQVGAFGDRSNAEALRQRLHGRLREPVLVSAPPTNGALYKVRIGPLASNTQTDSLRRELAALGLEAPILLQQ